MDVSFSYLLQKSCLFFSHKDPDGNTCEFKMLPNLVFQVALVGFPDVLRQVTVEGKCRGMCGQLRDVFDPDKLAFYSRRMVLFNGSQHHLIQFRGGNSYLTVCEDLNGQFQGFMDSLFG